MKIQILKKGFLKIWGLIAFFKHKLYANNLGTNSMQIT